MRLNKLPSPNPTEKTSVNKPATHHIINEATVDKPRTHHKKSKATGHTDLWHTYADAVKNDPTFQEQLAIFLGSKQATNQARSVLLPQISVDADLSETYETTQLGGFNRFNSNQYNVNLTQSIFNFAGLAQLKQAKISVRAAAVLLTAEEQDLIARVVRAYLNVLRNKELVAFTNMQRKFSWRFYKMIEQRHKLLHSTITEIEQAKGQYDLLVAEYISAKIDLYNSFQDLSAITGVNYTSLATFKKSFPLLNPVPNKLTVWLASAKQGNLRLHAAQLTVASEKAQILAAKGNYIPRVDVFGRYSDENELSTLVAGAVPEVIKTGEVGLNLSWNLFQGGLTISQVNRQRAAYQRARAALRREYFNTVVSTKKSFIGIVEGAKRVKSSRTAMSSNLSALKHGEESFTAGTQTIYDILQSQNRLFASQRKYVDDFYNYVLETILLKQAAGTLKPKDLIKMNYWLTPKVKKHTTVLRPSKDKGIDIDEYL